jgi:anti-sigma regulatory factor (Ser/Thr protein kinase)
MIDGIAGILELSLAPTLAAPSRARVAVSDWLAQERDDGLLTEIALLMVSELVANCVRHALIAAEEPLRLKAWLREPTLRLEVWDSGTEGTVAQRSRARDEEVGGFGLALVARLSSAWGVERNAKGTTVWLELPTAADATA